MQTKYLWCLILAIERRRAFCFLDRCWHLYIDVLSPLESPFSPQFRHKKRSGGASIFTTAMLDELVSSVICLMVFFAIFDHFAKRKPQGNPRPLDDPSKLHDYYRRVEEERRERERQYREAEEQRVNWQRRAAEEQRERERQRREAEEHRERDRQRRQDAERRQAEEQRERERQRREEAERRQAQEQRERERQRREAEEDQNRAHSSDAGGFWPWSQDSKENERQRQINEAQAEDRRREADKQAAFLRRQAEERHAAFLRREAAEGR